MRSKCREHAQHGTSDVYGVKLWFRIDDKDAVPAKEQSFARGYPQS
ncbi:hypothetical protein [Candidatus Sarmatiella mevalonica]|nr:hypothetical protein [Candidatus Sarmatiella mevalonica]